MASTVDLIQAAYDNVARGRIDLAIQDLQRHIRMHENDVDLHHHVSLLLLQTGRFDQALFHLDRAIQLAPKRADLHNNRATALNYKGKSSQAAEAYRRALELDPKSFPARLGLSSALVGTFEFDAAAQEARKAAELAQDQPEWAVNLSLALARSGRGDEAAAPLRQALERAPDHPLLLSNLAALLMTRPEASPAEVLEVNSRLGRVWTSFAGVPAPTFSDMNPTRRLRVGYLSQDFRDTAQAAFVRPLLKAHNRDQFEVVCYSVTHNPDKVTATLSPLADRWVEAARMPDVQLDQQIRADGIDILVDLSGFSPGSRLGVLARRSAPVQVSLATYPASTGLKAVGYRIVDAIADPEGSEPLAAEKLVRPDGPCLCYAPPEGAPGVSPRAVGPVTFGCFAATAKINERVLDAWAAILKAVPGSRLVLKNQAFGGESARARYRELLGARGIDAGRVEMAGHTPALKDHLAAYGRVDIALDTFPAGSPALACEAMHMGVPTVTLRGESHAGRVTASVLTAAGLGNLVAGSPEEYAKLAADLARDEGRRASLRSGLRAQLAGSPLCDAAGYAARIEAAYRSMWETACANVYYT